MKRKEEGRLVPLLIYVLTFNSCVLPEGISIGWTRRPVRLYIPRPRKCFQCQRFGHGAKTCRATEPVCVNCGDKRHEEICELPAHCINCEGQHPAHSTRCQCYVLECEILANQAKERISYADAKAAVLQRYIQPTVSFVNVMRESGTRDNPGSYDKQQRSPRQGNPMERSGQRKEHCSQGGSPTKQGRGTVGLEVDAVATEARESASDVGGTLSGAGSTAPGGSDAVLGIGAAARASAPTPSSNITLSSQGVTTSK